VIEKLRSFDTPAKKKFLPSLFFGIYKSNIGWKKFNKYEVRSVVSLYCGLNVFRE
jgi:hypothetical protein